MTATTTRYNAAWLASCSPRARSAFLASLSEAEAGALVYDWRFWARPAQLPPPGDWTVWLALAGRGFGKTRLGAEWVRDQVEHHGARRLALIGPTAADVRDVMVEGESGVLSVCPPWNRPRYEPSKRRLSWPNGARATTYSAEKPAGLRGPQHEIIWADELCAWRYDADTLDMALLGLRLGRAPRALVTGHHYRLEVRFTSGGQVLECFAWIYAER